MNRVIEVPRPKAGSHANERGLSVVPGNGQTIITGHVITML